MPKPKVVLDTNVVISSLWPGTSRRILDLWKQEQLIALVSEPIIREYLEVLERFSVPPEDLQQFIVLFTDPGRSIVVVPHERIQIIPQDPSDNKFLECAIAGRADSIISGDKHLKFLQSFREIPILPPAVFLAKYPQI